MWLGREREERKGKRERVMGEVREGNLDRENLELFDWGTRKSGNYEATIGLGGVEGKKKVRGSRGWWHGESEDVELLVVVLVGTWGCQEGTGGELDEVKVD
jgi:hypothetical protein